MKFKLPKLKLKFKFASIKGKKKKQIILVTTMTMIAIITVIVILYFTNRSFKRKIDELLKIGDAATLGPIVDRADNVEFSIPQNKVAPNSSFTITGQFTDITGKPVRVKEAHYHVVNKDELITQGIIGINVGKFSKTISTNGFPASNDYDVIVTDEPNFDAGAGAEGGGEGLKIAAEKSSLGGVSGLT